MFGARRQAVSRAVQSRRFISTKSLDYGLGVSELSLIVKAGSRYEPVPGVAHLLKTAAFQDTAARSGLRLQREAELLGGSVQAKLTKEHLVLTAKFLREDLPYFVEALADTATKPLFREYQFNEDIVPLAQAEATKKRQNVSYLAVEGAYEAAFRSGLSNPTYVSPESAVSLSQLKEYAAKAYTTENAQLFARNVNEADLAKFAGSDFAALGAGSLAAPEQKFFSGEFRVKSSSAEQTAVLAFPTKSFPCLAALKYALGGKSLKWSKGFGLLNEALSDDVTFRVHNDIFSDASLFYVVIRGATPEAVSAAIKTTASTIKGVAASLDETVAQKAIAKAKFAEINQASTIAPLLAPAPDLSKVSASSISAAAKSLVENHKVLSVVGKTYALPYVDELF